jgi:hypothetical protein
MRGLPAAGLLTGLLGALAAPSLANTAAIADSVRQEASRLAAQGRMEQALTLVERHAADVNKHLRESDELSARPEEENRHAEPRDDKPKRCVDQVLARDRDRGAPEDQQGDGGEKDHGAYL